MQTIQFQFNTLQFITIVSHVEHNDYKIMFCPMVNIDFWVAHFDLVVTLHHTIHIQANNVRAIGITSCFV
jgi:hypothetical protein